MRLLPIANERRYYVSLGDAQSRNAANYLGATSRFYNRLVASDPDLKMVPLATDGAATATVRFVQIPRLREMSVTPSVVTLTLGASDLPRLAFGDAEGVCRELREHGNAVLPMLRDLAPSAVLLLTTLYDPMDGTIPLLAGGVERFNDTLRSLATAHKGMITDIHSAFAGHGASVGDPLSVAASGGNTGLYLCAGADLVPVPNQHGAAVFAELMLSGYYAALTEETPPTSDLTTGGVSL